MRIRSTMDADMDQHGSASLYRRASIPIPIDTQTGYRIDRRHVVGGIRRIPSGHDVVPRAEGRRQCANMHVGISPQRARKRLFGIPGANVAAVLHRAVNLVRLPLPKNFS